MKLEKVDLVSKGARKLDSLASRINTKDYYLIKFSYNEGFHFEAGKFRNDYFWKFNEHQLTYKSDNLLDKSFLEIYRIVDEDILVNDAIIALKL